MMKKKIIKDENTYAIAYFLSYTKGAAQAPSHTYCITKIRPSPSSTKILVTPLAKQTKISVWSTTRYKWFLIRKTQYYCL